MASQVKSFTFTSPKVQETLAPTIVNTAAVTNIRVLPPAVESPTKFGHQSTIVKVIEPISMVRPVSYVPINPPSLYERPYVIVDKKVSYGNPITAEQYHQLANSRRTYIQEPNPAITIKKEAVRETNHLELNNSPVRRKIQVKVQESKTSAFCCCGGNRYTDSEVQNLN